MSSSLLPCPTCSRHVRRGDASCPFCASVLDASFGRSQARPTPGPRLVRAATFALGTALAISTGCGAPATATGGPPVEDDDTNGGNTEVDAGPRETDDRETQTTPPTPDPDPVPVSAYGAPSEPGPSPR